jgi:hypothetical protein
VENPPPPLEVVNLQRADLSDERCDRDAFMHNELPETQGVRIIPSQYERIELRRVGDKGLRRNKGEAIPF